ncbi:MAG TPA: hypothetical protein VNZ05_10500, partial [Solirubrobacteraceae bacterium]|nr:hypothetical protein [Solirubrobacteraceae bacterium]
MLRYVLWRLLGVLALLAALAAAAWLLSGGPGRALRGQPAGGAAGFLAALPEALRSAWGRVWALAQPLLWGALALAA